MKKRWKIRTAVPEDANGLRDCMDSAYTRYQARLGGKRLPPMDLDYVEEIKNYPTWVSECDGKVVGGITMMVEDGYASIANIAVHPDFQGQGLGSGLMAFAEAQAKDSNYSELRLATHVLLTENISLYLHLGWVEYDRDDVRVYMRKAI